MSSKSRVSGRESPGAGPLSPRLGRLPTTERDADKKHKSKPTILLVAHGVDEHSSHLESLLRARGHARVTRISTDILPNGDLTWSPGKNLILGDDHVPLYGAGLWRRPGFPSVSDYASEFRDFAVSECLDAFEGAVLANSITWLTHPSVLTYAELKLIQLQVARRLGITIPATLVTNSADKATRFAQKHQQVVVKPVRYGLLNNDAARPLVAWTSSVSEEDLQELKGPPVIVQERIDAEAHLRVVTIGQRTFAAALRTAELDWRSELSNHESFAPVADLDLMRLLEDQAQRVARVLQLGYSAQDWVLARSGKLFFLEANPNGQWLFLDDAFSGQISEFLAAELEALATAVT